MTTQAPNHAPLLIQRDYVDGGRLFWRVAAVDADANIGDYSPVVEFGIARTLKLRTLGSLVRNRSSQLVVTATASYDAIPGVAVKIWGAGIRPRTAKTNASGRVIFKLRPPKKGAIYIRATKSGFKTATMKVTVRGAY